MNTPIADTRCQSCGASMQTEYVLLGAVARCPQCAVLMVPHIPKGGSVPMHEYEVTYGDFRQLIEYQPYREALAPLLAEWFAYSIVEEGPDVLIRDHGGEMIDTLRLHLLIQDDPVRQRALYNTAMSLWR
jgi:hypothetical protein